MDLGKGVIGFLGVAFIAAGVAYTVSAPRNVDNFMNQELASLDGKSPNQVMLEAKVEADRAQCETFSELAAEAWDRAVENESLERDSSKIEELDRQVERYCK